MSSDPPPLDEFYGTTKKAGTRKVVVEICVPDRATAEDRIQLSYLTKKCVEAGASIGFTLPVAERELEIYWTKIFADAPAARYILVARDAGGRIIGSAQLAFETRSNGLHRAEVQKVMVLPEWRRENIGATLMVRLEAFARARSRSLLFLDTSVGESGACHFYERLGYQRAGSIPDYAADPHGRLEANAIYYKQLAV